MNIDNIDKINNNSATTTVINYKDTRKTVIKPWQKQFNQFTMNCFIHYLPQNFARTIFLDKLILNEWT